MVCVFTWVAELTLVVNGNSLWPCSLPHGGNWDFIGIYTFVSFRVKFTSASRVTNRSNCTVRSFPLHSSVWDVMKLSAIGLSSLFYAFSEAKGTGCVNVIWTGDEVSQSSISYLIKFSFFYRREKPWALHSYVQLVVISVVKLFLSAFLRLRSLAVGK